MEKLFLIIISAVHLTMADVRARLSLDYLKPVSTLSLADAQLQAGHISIGQYGNHILIVSNSLVSDFFRRQPTDFETRVRQNFPDAEIAVLTLNTTVNLYGYSIISEGKRQRIKSGAEQIVYIDEGKPLPEEAEVSRETNFSKEELADIRDKYTRSEAKAIIGNATGIKVVPLLLQRYFGGPDELKKNFNHVQVTVYQ